MGACQHAQRAVFNLGVAAVAAEGGTLAPLQKNPDAPDAFFAQLTEWRAKHEWLRNIPLAVTRPALSEARQALDKHGKALAERIQRLLDEDAAWEKWLRKHPDWDSGAWDRLSPDDRRAAVKAGQAPPASLSTWRDERAATARGNGCSSVARPARSARSRSTRPRRGSTQRGCAVP